MNYHNQRYPRERYPNARPRFSGPPEYIGTAPPLLDLRSTTMDLASYWQVVKHELVGLGYTLATARMYHRVLCALADHFRKRHHQHFKPSRVAACTVRDFIHSLADKRHSWSWIACNISALRTMFDKFGGLSVTKELVTPKRPSRLPEILSDTEAERLLASAPSLRDQLLLELMYRCGLKVGEACALRWQDINIQDRVLRVESARGTVSRLIPIPAQLSEVLAVVHSRCPAEAHLFRGKRLGEHLSPRMAHIVLANTLQGSRIHKPVTCMTLRHTFAVNSLRAGMNICRLRDILGHFSIETTMLYKHCTPPVAACPSLSLPGFVAPPAAPFSLSLPSDNCPRLAHHSSQSDGWITSPSPRGAGILPASPSPSPSPRGTGILPVSPSHPPVVENLVRNLVAPPSPDPFRRVVPPALSHVEG